MLLLNVGMVTMGLVVPSAPIVSQPPLTAPALIRSAVAPVDGHATVAQFLPTTDLLAAQIFGVGKEFSGYKERAYDEKAKDVMTAPAPQTDFKSKYEKYDKVSSRSAPSATEGPRRLLVPGSHPARASLCTWSRRRASGMDVCVVVFARAD